MDQTGWDAPFLGSETVAGDLSEPSFLADDDFNIKESYMASEYPAFDPSPLHSTPNRKKTAEIDYLSYDGFPSPLQSAQYTPHTRMFINGIVSPLKGPNSSPCPSHSPDRASGTGRSRRTSVSDCAPLPSLASTLLPPFSVDEASTDLSGNASMDVDDDVLPESCLGSPAKVRESLTSWQRDIFNPSARLDNGTKESSSFSLNSSTSSLASSASGVPSSSSWKSTSPSRSTERHRARSTSNAGASTSVVASGSSSGHKHSVGLMDAVLGNKSNRRKYGHLESRGDGEFGVTAMGSPFKMGKKMSRREFLYSDDGDCEMEDAQPRKRRKTISGRD